MMVSSAVCALLLAACVAADLVDDGYLRGVSGDVAVLPRGPQKIDAAVFVTDGDSNGKFVRGGAVGLGLGDVSNVVTTSLGLAPIGESARFSSVLKAQSLFHRPRANMLVTVAGLGSESVTSAASVFKRAVPSSHFSIPYSTAAYVASLATGVPPSKHGVVADAWTDAFGNIVTGDRTQMRQRSIADFIKQSFPNDQPMTVAFAADAAVSSIFCPKTSAAAALCMSVDASGKLTDAHGRNAATMEPARMWTLLSKNGFTVSQQGSALRITASGVNVVLNLEESRFAALASEVVAALSVVSAADNQHVNDDTPDFISFTFTSLQEILATATTEQRTAAMLLVDAAVRELIAQWNAKYPLRFVAEVVLLGNKAQITEQQMSELRSVADAHLGSQRPLPQPAGANQIWLPRGANVESVCVALEEATRATVIQIACPGTRHAHLASANDMDMFSTIELFVTVNNGSIPVPCDDNCQRWQVAQWLSIILVVVVFYTVYYMAFMDVKRDSLLYSKFGTNAGARKNQ